MFTSFSDLRPVPRSELNLLLPAYPAQPIHNNGNQDPRFHEAGYQLANSTQVWLIMNLWTRTYNGAGSSQQTNLTHERRRKDAVLLLWGAEINSKEIRGLKNKILPRNQIRWQHQRDIKWRGNGLPVNVREADTLSAFKIRLKTFLFDKAYS